MQIIVNPHGNIKSTLLSRFTGEETEAYESSSDFPSYLMRGVAEYKSRSG